MLWHKPEAPTLRPPALPITRAADDVRRTRAVLMAVGSVLRPPRTRDDKYPSWHGFDPSPHHQ
jgi:hypothetical protein